MTLNADDWSLPPLHDADAIDVSEGELLLIDYTLCSVSRFLPDYTMDSLLEDWHDVRMRVWQALDGISNGAEVPLELDTIVAKRLLAVLPTTHHWGTGPDFGRALKAKIAAWLRCEYEPKRYAAQPPTATAGDESRGC